MRVLINMNTGSLQVGASGSLGVATSAASYPQYGAITSNTFPGTCPIMLSPLVASALSGATISTAGAYPTNANLCIYPGIAVDCGTTSRTGLVLSVSIAKPDPIHKQLAANIVLKESTLANCRIYAPIIDMEPDLVSMYITNYKQQAIYYRDVLQFQQPGVAATKTFTTQVGNGFVNLQRLIIIPFYHDDTKTLPFEPTSPWSSAPSTVAPRSELVDFNVLVSNMNIFQRNISYSFENFLEEMGLANAINGGLDTGLTSGIPGYSDWQNAYRYYVVDLSRRLAGDNTPKSVTVIGRNNSLYTVDYYYFLQYKRHLTLDVESGHITVSSN
jgi:hypothetical protein